MQAEQLRAKAQRPEVDRSSQQMVRSLFYHGRICAIQLDYSDAKDLLSQALRKVCRPPALLDQTRNRKEASSRPSPTLHLMRTNSRRLQALKSPCRSHAGD